MWLPKYVFWSPQSLILDITNNCNLRCIMCRTQLLKEKSITWNYLDFLTATKNFSPRGVALGGTGEPFMNKELGSMIENLYDRGIKVTVNTNGTLLGNVGNWLKKVNLFKISLDACTPESYKLIRGDGDFREIISNIKKIREQEISVRLEYVVMSINYKEIKEFIQFAKGLKVNGVFFRLFQGTNLPKDPEIDFCYIPTLKEELLIAKQTAKKLKIRSNLPDLCQKLDYIKRRYSGEKIIDNRRDHICLLPWLQFFIRADGETAPCCQLLELEDLSTGNVFETNNIWNSDKMKKLRNLFLYKKNYDIFSSCQDCEFLDWRQLLKWTKLVPRWFI